MPAHKLYFTPEEKAAAKRRDRAKYQASPKGRTRRAAWQEGHPELMSAAYARYRQTPAYREAQQRYKTSPKGRERGSNYFEWAKASDPIRIKARAAVMIAIRQGTIVRPAHCDACGQPRKPDAHHHFGYAPEHWLTFVWLCRPCHKAAHS